MYLKLLNLRNFRNYAEASFAPSPGFNILIGKNAQGKSNLVEAVYLAAMAHSWRTRRDAEMILWGQQYGAVFAKIAREKREDIEVEIVLEQFGKKQIRINTIRQSKLSEIMGQANVLLVNPGDVEIIRGEPSERRKFLNIEVSQMQPQYCHLLACYKKVLEQKNRLLKELQQAGNRRDELLAWNEQMVVYGAQILERRWQFVEKLAPLASKIHLQLTDGAESLEVEYISGIGSLDGAAPSEIACILERCLSERMGEEIRRGMSLVGPHRDDLSFRINKVDARVYGSYGQQRTAALSLRLAELELMREITGESPIVLLDDVMADLDEERRARVFAAVGGDCQTFATASTLSLFASDVVEHASVFTVSGGMVTAQ